MWSISVLYGSLINLLNKFQISKLKKERNTLRLVHNKLVALLNEQCMERDQVLAEKIKFCSNPDEALLMQEVMITNTLIFYADICHTNIFRFEKIACSPMRIFNCSKKLIIYNPFCKSNLKIPCHQIVRINQ